ncbi:MAG: hypothetical protein HC852_23990 [Acaryochloridaceae cyanobacterium RU_4_10]|nr:hypothetical protein [Acaryochloridaceae cyanobacterium RU_4_10]
MAQQEANKRTESSRGFGTQSQGKKQVSVKTLGNVESLNVHHMLRRGLGHLKGGKHKSVKPGQRGKERGQGILSIPAVVRDGRRRPPLVWSTVASFGMMSASFAMARTQLRKWEIELSEQRVERLTYCFGRAGVQLTEQWMAQLQQGQLVVGDTLRG